jgi:hypothetical protein
LRDATEAAVAFSARTGDLDTAAQMLGRAYLGSTNRLIMYGIKIDESIPKEQRFAEVMRQAMKNQEGVRKETETFTGTLKQLWNQISDVGEVVGKELAEPLKDLMKYVLSNKAEILQFAQDLALWIADWARDLGTVVKFLMSEEGKIFMRGAAKGAAAGGVFGGIFGGLPGAALGILGGGAAGGAAALHSGSADNMFFGSPTGDDGVDLGPIGGGRKRGAKPPTGLAPGGGTGNTENDPESFENRWKKAFRNVATNARDLGGTISMIMSGVQSTLSSGFAMMFTNLADHTMKIGEIMKNFMLSFRDLFFKVVAEMLAKWVVAKLAEAAASKASIMVSIMGYMAQAKAAVMAAYAAIPGVGIALGLAAVAVIAGIMTGFINFAQGGIVDKPTMARIGETGDREAVINLDSQKGKRALREAGGGGGGRGGASVVIQGMFLEADEAKWERLTRTVIIPMLDNYGQKTRDGVRFSRT